MSTALGDLIMAPARVAGAACRDAANFLVLRNLAEQIREHRRIADVALQAATRRTGYHGGASPWFRVTGYENTPFACGHPPHGKSSCSAFTCRIYEQAERWPSGRRHTPAKGAGGKPSRGFESLPLRHIANGDNFQVKSTSWQEGRPASHTCFPHTPPTQFKDSGWMAFLVASITPIRDCGARKCLVGMRSAVRADNQRRSG